MSVHQEFSIRYNVVANWNDLNLFSFFFSPLHILFKTLYKKGKNAIHAERNSNRGFVLIAKQTFKEETLCLRRSKRLEERLVRNLDLSILVVWPVLRVSRVLKSIAFSFWSLSKFVEDYWNIFRIVIVEFVRRARRRDNFIIIEWCHILAELSAFFFTFSLSLCCFPFKVVKIWKFLFTNLANCEDLKGSGFIL